MAAAIPIGLMVAGKLVQGVGGMAAANANSRALKEQARGELAAGTREEERLRENARKAMGEQVAAQFGNGLMGGTGSALDALRESKINAALDALTIRRAAREKSDALLARAKQEKRAGRLSLVSSILGAGSAAMGGSADWADARRGMGGG